MKFWFSQRRFGFILLAQIHQVVSRNTKKVLQIFDTSFHIYLMQELQKSKRKETSMMDFCATSKIMHIWQHFFAPYLVNFWLLKWDSSFSAVTNNPTQKI